jgi:hypothetical protein
MGLFRVPILIDQTLRVQWVLHLVEFDKFDSPYKAYRRKHKIKYRKQIITYFTA